jgi:NADPH-dependent 2,4-dienoyl-CoA reductase/sulfur reductase-like enzyme
VTAVLTHGHVLSLAGDCDNPALTGWPKAAGSVPAMAERLVVVGCDAGGMTAATQARRGRPDLEIIALEKGSFTSYSACGIPYLVSGAVEHIDDLVVRTPQQFRDAHRIDVRTRHEVMGIDLDHRRLDVRDTAHDRTIEIGFDLLHIATGAHPIRPSLPGIDSDWVRGVQTLEDGKALLDRIAQSRCGNVVVVGGGYIGLEMAEAFVQRGASVVLVEGGEQLMRTIDPDMGAKVADAVRRHGIDLRLGSTVTGFDRGAVHTDAGTFPADLAVLGLGVAPNTRLAADAGIELGPRDAITVNARQHTSADGVWAAGDCADSFHLVSHRRIHVALGTVANKQGRVAGINIGGGYATFPGVVGTAVTRVCDTEIARTGLSELEARHAGLEFVAATVDSTTRAGYFPGNAPLTVKVLAEQKTGRVLGGQIVGADRAAKRIDTLATAITAGMTAAEVVDLDLSYAPPISPVWDPVQIAARRANELLR